MMAQTSKIDVHDLPEPLIKTAPNTGATDAYPMVSIEEIQRLHARRVLDSVGGHKTMAAQILQVSRATLYRLLAGRSA